MTHNHLQRATVYGLSPMPSLQSILKLQKSVIGMLDFSSNKANRLSKQTKHQKTRRCTNKCNPNKTKKVSFVRHQQYCRESETVAGTRFFTREQIIFPYQITCQTVSCWISCAGENVE